VRLVLFDVDGTLVTAHGAGREALRHALLSIYGTTGPIDDYDFRGKTDPRIVLDLMAAAGLDDARVSVGLERCFKAYVDTLDRLVGDGARVEALPGIADLVRALAVRTDVVVGLLTGNIEAGARVKLRPTGLWPLFRVGAFGSDDPDRRCLPPIARRRASALVGGEIEPERVIVIGDTPLDVDCARACGAVAVAVATGQHASVDLEACAPDLLFADFSDVAAAVTRLLGTD
jgi:phosphoglycolate phosphatase-like HAD superfamily hydrolase